MKLSPLPYAAENTHENKDNTKKHKEVLLSKLKPGQKGRVARLLKPIANLDKQIFHKFLTMGLIAGTNVEVLCIAPFGDPVQIKIRGYKLALRKSEAKLIEVILDS